MTIPDQIFQLLLSDSGGYCQNPTCNKNVFVFFENGTISNIKELAHIIAQKDNGPRGNDQLPATQRDEYENIILLCPNCHTLVDKNPDQFPIEILQQWKIEHSQKIKSLFDVPFFDSRKELRDEVKRLLNENYQCFLSYGPFSETISDPLSDAEEIWRYLIKTTILPNNRRLSELLTKNDHLLSDDEKKIVAKFIVHATSFEFNHMSGNKISSTILFPTEMNMVLED